MEKGGTQAPKWAILNFWPFRWLLRLDGVLLVVLVYHALLLVPLIPRATDNPFLLAAFINDEPPLTMALDGMTTWPYGNPANYLKGNNVPEYWFNFRYTGFFYYGGTYLDLGFLVFAPLKMGLGLPTFPWAPIILRSISYLSSALSLIVLYHLGKRIWGSWLAIVPVLFLLLDPHFIYYSKIIHPDILQLLLSLVALVVAIKHTQSGKWREVIWLGMLLGLHHGTKMGGPWLLPMLMLAIWWGWRKTFPSGHTFWSMVLWRDLGARYLVLVGAGGLFFFLSTPYAFLGKDYFEALRGLSHALTQNLLTPVSFYSWIQGLGNHLGWFWFLAAIVAFLTVWFHPVHDPTRQPLLLATTLILANVLWFACLGRLWVVIGYYLCAIALIGLLLTELALRIGCLAQHRWSWHPRWRYGAVVLFLIINIGEHWSIGPRCVLCDLISSRVDTRLSVGQWAEQHIPFGSRILYDDLAYFNPRYFPNQKMHGGVVTYGTLQTHQPDYLVLSESLFGSAWYTEMRKKQKLSRTDPNPYSMRLYQDLLNRRSDPCQLGPTGVPGIELVAVFQDQRKYLSTQPSPHGKRDLQDASWNLFRQLRKWFRDRWLDAQGVYTLAREATGIEHHERGPTLLVYRIAPSFRIPPE